ncbi:sigma intracellular receptor 2 [Brachypodium distachyon]|uniref:EXPERA domain-containing protein n=1 Tax=Brachypodium distachyon TaxID=15368 RepID=A0A2K2DKC7_BRADI|nr:sigma intracellular receptor 2 [Brachypodium distachyon]PNT74734.1 hypothetical protein BRADI_1g21152v3 [Brachypodium distachyon]|eukprot:XP_003559948.2 sigma intracellular receptor 2 [Brachypodium distachyon]
MEGMSSTAMGVLTTAADVVIVIFATTIAFLAPLLVSQAVLPRRFFPAPLVAFRRWYAAKFNDYLAADDPPAFFRGITWLELAFEWPLWVASIYGILAHRSWAGTTVLMAGVFTLTSLSAILGDILGSGRATKKLLLVHIPYAIFAVIAIIRGLTILGFPAVTIGSSLAPSAWKII